MHGAGDPGEFAALVSYVALQAGRVWTDEAPERPAGQDVNGGVKLSGSGRVGTSAAADAAGADIRRPGARFGRAHTIEVLASEIPPRLWKRRQRIPFSPLDPITRQVFSVTLPRCRYGSLVYLSPCLLLLLKPPPLAERRGGCGMTAGEGHSTTTNPLTTLYRATRVSAPSKSLQRLLSRTALSLSGSD
jgi:hypothetical protein